MIPKIIHLCWLSGDPYPPEIQACLDTWKKHLPDYEIWLWNTKRFDINSTLWTRQAYEAKKYAFAADYIRLYALFNYGGIYLDSDVIVYKSFDSLLHLPYFIGHDQIRAFEAAVIGAEKGCKWIKDVLDTFQDRSFIKDDGIFDTLPMPCRLHHILIQKGYHFKRIKKIENYKEEERLMFVFDKNFFNSRDAVEVHPTKQSFCAHNYASSWRKKKQNKVKVFMPKRLLKIIYQVGYKTWNRNKYAWFQIPFEK